jgi:hypothetical protein
MKWGAAAGWQGLVMLEKMVWVQVPSAGTVDWLPLEVQQKTRRRLLADLPLHLDDVYFRAPVLLYIAAALLEKGLVVYKQKVRMANEKVKERLTEILMDQISERPNPISGHLYDQEFCFLRTVS